MAESPWLPVPATAEIPRLALRLRDAARAVGVSDRTLWGWTRDGLVPVVRINGTVLYAVDSLRAFLAERAKKEKPAVDAAGKLETPMD